MVVSSVAKRVLLVEDDQEIREMIAEILTEEGYDVVCAINGADALGRMRVFQPDVILLDLMMPVMDGWDFRSAQQEHQGWATIPVVVLTADGSAEKRASELNASGLLKKPLNVADLLDAVEQACGI